ncbi:MAG TPA: VOC family protein [Burkholderiales bacterium]|nr:VOC family protein [Burkholderiales bacterium]
MSVIRIDHINITVGPEKIGMIRDFYLRALDLREGPRPAFPFPGCWLYAGEQAIVHIAGKTPASDAADTGKLNHVALACDDIAAMTARFEQQRIPYRVRDVPGQRLRQIFITDPAGVVLELNFTVGSV